MSKIEYTDQTIVIPAEAQKKLEQFFVCAIGAAHMEDAWNNPSDTHFIKGERAKEQVIKRLQLSFEIYTELSEEFTDLMNAIITPAVKK